MAKHNLLGKKGEEMAQSYLMRKGYELLETNYRYQKAEIDIIARKNNLIAIVEVKTRKSSDYGEPESFLKPAQIKRLVNAANFYIEQLDDASIEVRFDIVSILLDGRKASIEHIEDAFYHF